ncbi:hypothetical protein Anapl_15572 [Anas platyrhynchos]|uniref:Uncharacterized protein n=1 Tax=Anas platyrhynchos TaxID=8839 RepID=R0LCX1_ANAPL|nr:hypothetical protein Anapl_15572 [Anas platyrhynchos]
MRSVTAVSQAPPACHGMVMDNRLLVVWLHGSNCCTTGAHPWISKRLSTECSYGVLPSFSDGNSTNQKFLAKTAVKLTVQQ